jgi:AcrR family transcriptional regulator
MTAAASTAKRSRTGFRRKALLDAAARRFRVQGYAAASMRDIAGDIGLLGGSVYYHFPSKEDLLVAVHKEGIRRITEAFTIAVSETAGAGPWRRLEAACTTHLVVLLDGGDYAAVMTREPPPDFEPAARARLVELRDAYEDLFRRLIATLPLAAGVDRTHLRLMLMGALNWTQNWYRPGGASPAEIAHHFVELLRRQLDPEAASP